MKYEKEKLLRLLTLIEEIYNRPGNEWFKDELLKLLTHGRLNTSFNSNTMLLDKKIDLIQEYLFINTDKLIDYRGFEINTKDQLTRDCIEMIRYHKETPNHKKNFDEFCRFAHLQVEEMLNYFYLKKFKNLNESIKIIKDYNDKYLPQRTPKAIEQIPFLTKIIAFQNLIKPVYNSHLHSTMTFLNDMRNEFSHRSTLTKKKDDEELARFQKEFPNYKIGDFIDFKKTGKMEIDVFNKGTYIIRKREQDFSIIYKHLDDFKNVILESLDAKKIIMPKSSIGAINPILSSIKDKLEKK